MKERVYSFSELKFCPFFRIGQKDGHQAWIFFDNGYGLSVVEHSDAYSDVNRGLFEVAIVKGTAENHKICYTTPIANEVIGYQNAEQITKLMNKTAALPSVLVNGRTFDLTDDFPDGYEVWNIGRNNFNHPGFIPLCKVDKDHHVDIWTLKYMRVPGGEEKALQVLKMAGKKLYNKRRYDEFMKTIA